VTDSSFILELYSIVHAARIRPRWSVLLVPTSKYEMTLMTISALSDVPFYGRTIVWPDTNRKLTVTHSGAEIFLTKGGFDLFLAGWEKESKEDTRMLMEWKAAANEFVPTSDAFFSSSSRLDERGSSSMRA